MWLALVSSTDELPGHHHHDVDLALQYPGGNDRDVQRELVLDFRRGCLRPRRVAIDFIETRASEETIKGLCCDDERRRA